MNMLDVPKELHMNGETAEISTHNDGDWTITRISERVGSLMDFSSQQLGKLLKGL